VLVSHPVPCYINITVLKVLSFIYSLFLSKGVRAMASFFRSNWWKALILLVLLGAAFWWVLLPWYIFDKGSPAKATVLDVWSTNTTVNDEPVAGLLLEIYPTGGDSFQVKRNCRVSFDTEWLFRPGAQVEIKYDPRLPQRIVFISAPCDQEFASIWLFALGTITFIFLSFIAAPPLINRFMFHSDLLSEGIPAKATVLRIWDTGVTINDQPRLGMLLHIAPQEGEPFDVETKQIVPHSALGGFVTGAEVNIRYDERKPSRIVFQWASIEGASVDPADRLEKLEKLRSQLLISEEEYQQMRKSILEAI
jgi:hypothetical protein